MNGLIASAWLVFNPVQVELLDLSYKPCMQMFEAAKKSGNPHDMNRVVSLCTAKTFSGEL
jgi:hypothetical protein